MVSLVRVATPADAADIAHVHVATWRSAYRDLLPTDFLASLSESQYEERWTRTLGDPDTRIYVAESASGIVGFASGGPERAGETGFAGELYAIYVLQEAQGHGHGRRLINASVRGLRELGLADMIVWVLRDNAPARKFYERLGGKYVRVQQITIGSSLLYEVAYGWRSLNDVVY